MEDKKSFILYLSQYLAIKDDLTDEQLGRLMRAIFESQLGNEVEIDTDIKIAFNFINNQIAVDDEKWEGTKQKRSQAGQKGAEKRWQSNGKNSKAINSDGKNSKAINEMANMAVNVNGNVNVNVNDISTATAVDNTHAPADQVYVYYQNNIDLLTERTLEVIEPYRKTMPDDLLIYAMQLAVEAKARRLNYVEGVLRAWSKKGIKTLLQAKEEREEFRNKKSAPVADDDWEQFLKKNREVESHDSG